MNSLPSVMRFPTTTEFRGRWHALYAEEEIRPWIRAGEPFEACGYRFAVQIRNGRREVRDIKTGGFWAAIFRFFTCLGRAATRRQLQATVDPLETGPRLVANGNGPIGKVVITGEESPAVTFRGRLLLSTSCEHAALAHADFHGAELRNVDFAGADLRNAKMTDLKALQHCCFKGANLTGACITLDEAFLGRTCETHRERVLEDLRRSIETIDARYTPLRGQLLQQLANLGDRPPAEPPRAITESGLNPSLHAQPRLYPDLKAESRLYPSLYAEPRPYPSLKAERPLYPSLYESALYDPELALSGFPVAQFRMFAPQPVPSAPPWEPSDVDRPVW